MQQSDENKLTEKEENLIQPLDFTSHEEMLILRSLRRLIVVEKSDLQPQWKLGDPEFFNIVLIIYSASHSPDLDARTLASVPWGSLYLLREYLRLNPKLRDTLNERIRKYAGSTRWNTSIITHRMQIVIDTFLYYHGWKSYGPMTVYASPVDWHIPSPRSFQVVVTISKGEILMTYDDLIVPDEEYITMTESAVSWVLWAVFAYPNEIGLKSVPFW